MANFYICSFLLAGITGSDGVDHTLEWHDPCKASGYMGDIALSDQDMAFFNATMGEARIKNHRKRRAAALNDRLWPRGVIPYRFRHHWDARMIKMFQTQMREWEHHTCVQFVSEIPDRG